MRIQLKPVVTTEHREQHVQINGTSYSASSQHPTEIPDEVVSHFTDYEEVAVPKKTKDKPKKAQKRK